MADQKDVLTFFVNLSSNDTLLGDDGLLTTAMNETATMYPIMDEDDEEGFFKYAWWQYFIIPWVAGLVGYFTNVLALEMTFYPVEFWGIEIFRIKTEPWGLFGWQGIIPTKGALEIVCMV